MNNKIDLKVYTSFVSPLTLDEFVKKGLLPIFILRCISNSDLIGKYSNTPVHLKELSPSTSLFRSKRDNYITLEEYKKQYAIEMSNVDLTETLKKLSMIANIADAKGVVLLGYGSSNELCHRSTLAEILNKSGLLVDRVKEIII